MSTLINMAAKPKATRPSPARPSSPEAVEYCKRCGTNPCTCHDAARKPVPELPTSWDLRTHCGTCGEPKNVLLVHRMKVGDRIVEWTICVSCQVRENRLAS